MPRAGDYYQQQSSQGTLPVSSKPAYSSPLLVQPGQQSSPKMTDPNDPKLVAASNRGFFSLFGQGLRETITGQRFFGESQQGAEQRLAQDWDSRSFGNKTLDIAGGTASFLVNYAKALPANVIKGGVNLAYDASEAVDDASHAVFGTRKIVPQEYDLANLYRGAKLKTDPLGFLLDRTNFLGGGGKVSGYHLTYNEASEGVRNAAYIGPTASKLGVDKFFGALMTTGKVLGDALIGDMIRTGVQGAFKPSIATVEKLGTAADTRPLTPDALSQVKMKVSEATGGAYKPSITFDQPSNGVMLRIGPDAIESAGLPKGNYALRFTPAGKGLVNADVIQIRASAVSRGLDWMKSKFGPANVVETEMGPGVKVRSGLVQYDPSVIAQAGDTMPAWLNSGEAALPAVQGAPAVPAIQNAAGVPEAAPIDAGVPSAIPAATGAAVEAATQTPGGVPPIQTVPPGVPARPAPGAPDELPFYDAANGTDLSQISAAAKAQLGQQVPAVMAKPLKGFEDAKVTPEQISQIIRVQSDRNLSDMDVFAINKSLTGKNNLADLTQKQAYSVAETIRMFGATTPEANTDSAIPSWIHPARYWVDPGIYYGVEQGYRLANVLTKKLGQQDTDMLGKYADPKYAPERRLITSYAEGNTAAILQNPALDEATKAELAKIGDQVIEKFKSLKDIAGIQSTAYDGQYVPHIRKLDSVAAHYKDLENIPELRPFFEFLRQGSDVPLEDDIATIMDVYNKAVGTGKFLRQAFDDAKSKMSMMGPAERRATADYLQEKLGYQGTVEKYLNNWSQKIADASDGKLPSDILRKTFNWAMKNSYAATLGLRPMAVVSQLTQALVMNYAEFGTDMFHGFKTLVNKGQREEFSNSGYLPERGKTQPSEPAATMAGKLGQKALQLHEGLQDISMKGFSWGDAIGRQAGYFNVQKRFNDNYAAFQSGKISFDQFEKNISMDGYSPALQGIIRSKLLANTPESIAEARDLATMQTLDSSFLPSRKGTESRAFYGMKGQAGLQFASYPFEMVHTIGDWVKRGQWGKLIRFLAMSTLIKRSADDVGINVNNALVFGSFAAAPVGPLANAAFELLKIPFANNADDINASWSNVADALKNYGGVGVGIEAQRLRDFKYSIDMYRRGHPQPDPTDPNAKFGIYSQASGKLKQTVPFSDLLKYGMNIPLTSTQEWSERVNQESQGTKARTAKIDEAVNALVRGDYKKFNDLVNQNQLPIGDLQTKIQSYDIPLDRRLYNSMPVDMKARFYPLFVPKN